VINIHYFCAMHNHKKIFRILFVCLGNICRSPAAEAIFKSFAEKEGLPVFVDSAGTSGWHEGEKADSRMRAHARKHGYEITSISRPFRRSSDFDQFDIIVPMDDSNFYDLKEQAKTIEESEKIVHISDFIAGSGYSYIPDPYYGGEEGFLLVIKLLEKASARLVADLRNRMNEN
jgi:protein-tyrosine phosphatase